MTDTSPHLLLIAWSFPPARTAGVYRALAMANAFAERGWTVTVLCAPEESLVALRGIDRSLLSHLHENVTMKPVPFTWSFRDPNIRTFPLARVFTPAARYARRAERKDAKVFPEVNYGQWRPALERAALAVHREHPVTLTIASANPNVDFAGAHFLHRKAGVPYVMDYRDAWRLDVYSGEAFHPKDAPAGRLEQVYLRDAHEVWFVNDPIRDWHRGEHPAEASKMKVVENGWDPEFTPASDRDAPRPAPTGALEFGYLGTVTKQLPLTEMLEGWAWAKERGLLPPDSRLNIAGHLGTSASPDSRMHGAITAATAVGAAFVGHVAKEDVAAFYASQHALVLAVSAGRYVTSGKVYEYLATAKPIIAIHEPSNDTTRVHAGYPLLVAAQELTAPSVGEAFGRAVELLKNATDADFQRAYEFSIACRRDQQLGPAVDALVGRFGS